MQRGEHIPSETPTIWANCKCNAWCFEQWNRQVSLVSLFISNQGISLGCRRNYRLLPMRSYSISISVCHIVRTDIIVGWFLFSLSLFVSSSVYLTVITSFLLDYKQHYGVVSFDVFRHIENENVCLSLFTLIYIASSFRVLNGLVWEISWSEI